VLFIVVLLCFFGDGVALFLLGYNDENNESIATAALSHNYLGGEITKSNNTSFLEVEKTPPTPQQQQKYKEGDFLRRSNITMYHINPLSFAPDPININLGDLAGEIFGICNKYFWLLAAPMIQAEYSVATPNFWQRYSCH